MNYYKDAQSDAKSMIDHFADEIVEQLINYGEASDDLLNDYPNGDRYHHENHVNKDYKLTEAAALLDQLSDYEETDNGLWEGLEPRRAISVQAAYTYGNAVYSLWRNLIEKINCEFANNQELAESEIDEQVDNYDLTDCRKYLTDHPDCDFDIGELDPITDEEIDLNSAKDAIKEHRKETTKAEVAKGTIEEVNA